MGERIAQTWLDNLTNLSIDIMVGQGYDGAVAMNGFNDV